jgi:DNA-binding transcriptional ArsR family regulator
VFEVIAEPNRRAILSLLVSSQQSVGEMERQLGMPQPAVSKHLRVLGGSLGTVGATVNLTWVGRPTPIETTVTRADAPRLLEYGDIRWELEAFGGGTRMTVWHSIDRRFISWGAAGGHICFDVLDRLLSGTPIGPIAGGDSMKIGGWQRLTAEYAKQFGMEAPNWPSQTARKS